MTRLPARWILLRGLGREAGHWATFPEILRATFPGEPVLTPDLPGCGIRCHEVAPTTVPALAEAVRTAVNAAGPYAGNTWLLGLSLGGMVALHWARAYGDEIAGVVLVNSSAASLSPAWRRLRPAALLTLLLAAGTRDPVRRERRIFDLTSARPERGGDAVATAVRLARANPISAANVGRLLLAAAKYRPGPTTQLTPNGPAALVLVGTQDRLAHPTCSGRLAELLGADLGVHPTAGHELPLDDPDWVMEELRRWRACREKVCGTGTL